MVGLELVVWCLTLNVHGQHGTVSMPLVSFKPSSDTRTVGSSSRMHLAEVGAAPPLWLAGRVMVGARLQAVMSPSIAEFDKSSHVPSAHLALMRPLVAAQAHTHIHTHAQVQNPKTLKPTL